MNLHLPKEHGAWVQLGFALLAPLLLGAPTPASFALVGAGLLAFWAHEPLCLLLGQRGERRRLQALPGARWLLALLGSLAAALGVASVLLLPVGARAAVHPPLVLGALMLLFIAAGKEKSTAGELLAAAALASWAVPVSVAGGQGGVFALQVWLAFGASFALGTLAIRAVIQAAKPSRPRRLRVATACAAASGLAVLLALALLGRLHPAVGLAVVPCALFALWVAAALPHPRALKRLGWSLAAACLLCATSLVVGVRLLGT